MRKEDVATAQFTNNMNAKNKLCITCTQAYCCAIPITETASNCFFQQREDIQMLLALEEPRKPQKQEEDGIKWYNCEGNYL